MSEIATARTCADAPRYVSWYAARFPLEASAKLLKQAIARG
jgi:hypothetical protein